MEIELDFLAVSGVNSLSQSLSANPLTATTLIHLDLSGSGLRGDDLSVGFSLLNAIFKEVVFKKARIISKHGFLAHFPLFLFIMTP